MCGLELMSEEELQRMAAVALANATHTSSRGAVFASMLLYTPCDSANVSWETIGRKRGRQ